MNRGPASSPGPVPRSRRAKPGAAPLTCDSFRRCRWARKPIHRGPRDNPQARAWRRRLFRAKDRAAPCSSRLGSRRPRARRAGNHPCSKRNSRTGSGADPPRSDGRVTVDLLPGGRCGDGNRSGVDAQHRINVQLCGDAHVLNFGLWRTPERTSLSTSGTSTRPFRARSNGTSSASPPRSWSWHGTMAVGSWCATIGFGSIARICRQAPRVRDDAGDRHLVRPGRCRQTQRSSRAVRRRRTRKLDRTQGT
jgi:Uncharacterized protein conserved in bacteria (DUF2252)